MKSNIIITVVVLLTINIISAISAYSQNITGTVYDINDKNVKNPLPGVNVYWVGNTIGTTTNEKGEFQIKRKDAGSQKLVFSFLGYKSDTIIVKKQTNLEVALTPENKTLNEVVIRNKDGGSYISKVNARKVQVITSGELTRAACCNLAESFETNASVDVNYSDAITGAKQIQLLGLSGLYSQIISENVPLIRGLGASFGLNYIPGSWMESIQVSKGTSSVINGPESVTGQINVEYKKPATSEKLFVNLYVNSNQRYEANFNTAYKFNPKLSTMLFGHIDGLDHSFDQNHDLFMDVPKVHTANFFNRWDYMVPGKWVSRFGIKYLSERRDGGFMNYSQKDYTLDTAGISNKTKSYGILLKTERMEGFWKNGIMFPEKPWKSVALIVSGIYHDQTGTFGLNTYSGKEKSFFSNLLYQSIIGNENHKFTTGLSFSNNDYTENYLRTNFIYQYQVPGDTTGNLFKLVDYHRVNYNMDRTERVIGGYFEYTYHFKDVFSMIAGIRVDNHNKFGTFYTPRFNFKWQLNETVTLRGSAGKGFRTANIFAENYSLMASQRLLIFVEPLKQEEAWNMGMNITKDFTILSRKAQFDIEFYRTDFINQTVVDMDSLPQSVFFYNLHGQSFSNCLQAQLSFEPVKRLNLLVAYRINDVRMTINGKLREKPFTNAYKGLVTVSYATKFDKWKFDITGQFNGPVRIPDTRKMPAILQRDNYSPSYFNLLAQVTKKHKNWDFYVGGENLTNFIQKDPITEYFAPYHTHFDTSMVWGPLVGTTIYAGLRYTLK